MRFFLGVVKHTHTHTRRRKGCRPVTAQEVEDADEDAQGKPSCGVAQVVVAAPAVAHGVVADVTLRSHVSHEPPRLPKYLR